MHYSCFDTKRHCMLTCCRLC